ncbi:MAG: TatD family hydrolase [Chthoniobacteraceae bacterium]|nr:TatD family hydrolase [Chthoniobacteraceae bacterium]
MLLYDAHNHLQDAALTPHLPAIVPALRGIGLSRAAVNGTREADWDAVAALAAAHPWVVPCYGLHPWYVKERSPRWRERLAECLAGGKAGVGEIGLDRWIAGFDLADQTAVFAWQLDLAAQRGLPVSIHCLQAWGALEDVLRERRVPECGFLLHAYGGPAEMVDGFLRRGAYFSFSGHFLEERKAGRREIFRTLPAERLLVETDAPDMTPPPGFRPFALPDRPDGRPVNHPANLLAVYEGLAALRGCPVETLAARVAENFARLFGSPATLPAPPLPGA